jgi:hypothetical protein
MLLDVTHDIRRRDKRDKRRRQLQKCCIKTRDSLLTFLFMYLLLFKIFVYYLLASLISPQAKDFLTQFGFYLAGIVFTFTEIKIIFKC